MSARHEGAYKCLNVNKIRFYETCGHNELCPYKDDGSQFLIYPQHNQIRWDGRKNITNPQGRRNSLIGHLLSDLQVC